MEAKPVSEEQLNFWKFCSIVLDVFPKVLRKLFVELWNKKFPHRSRDDSKTGKSIEKWDCTSLFQETIYAKRFASKGSTLNDLYLEKVKPAPGSFHSSVESSTGNQDETYALAIDQLRLLRNELCHMNKGEIIKTKFDDNVQRVTDALKAVKAHSSFFDEIDKIKKLDFDTEKVPQLEDRLKKEKEASMAASNKTITASGDNSIIYIADYITVNNYGDGHGPAITLPVSNCDEKPEHYWPRKKLDDEVRNIKKGKPKILCGTIGTGKTFAALQYIVSNEQNFAISWTIDVSDKDKFSNSLNGLAEELHVKYDDHHDLFKTIKQIGQEKRVLFLLDDVAENAGTFNGFNQLWNIRRSVYIIMTTNNPCLDFPDAEQLEVETFDEALDFLREINPEENSKEDLENLCEYFDWNVFGLAVAKDYISSKRIKVSRYLKMLNSREAAKTVREREEQRHKQTLYKSVRLCLEEIDDDKFDAIAATSLVSNNMIPEFLLSNLLPSRNHSANQADLDVLHDQLKSLVRISRKNDIRFFSFNSFTQHVIRDMIDESKKAHLLYKLAGIFVRHISKDNRFSKGDFLQRTVREHAEIFLLEWENKQKDDRTLIALARLSELVGFTYTQQQPFLEVKAHDNFNRAREMLHKLCEITEQDVGLHKRPVSRVGREIYDITENDLVVAHQLFEKLSKKSSNLPQESTVKELVFLRTVSKQAFSTFPEVVKKNPTLKEKIDSEEPLSPSDVKVLVHHKVAYSVDQYAKWFLPELYLSVIYSFGRNYFYMNRATINNPRFYIDLLKLAYCLSREISQQMNDSDNPGAVFHEFLVQTNGLLYLLVNDDCFNQDDARMTKEAEIHARDLENAIGRYQELLDDKRKFFEMGILKKTKDDTYSKLVCYTQILKCYKHTLPLTTNKADHEKYIKDGDDYCRDVFQLLDVYGEKIEDQPVRNSALMNAVGEFHLSTNQEEKYSEVEKIFSRSLDHAKYHNLVLYHLEALVGLADVCSRIGKNDHSATQKSIRHLECCYSNESVSELLDKKPDIQERIIKIKKQNSQNKRRKKEGDDDGESHETFEGDAEDTTDEEISAALGDDDGGSHKTFEADAVETTDEDIIAEPVKKKKK